MKRTKNLKQNNFVKIQIRKRNLKKLKTQKNDKILGKNKLKTKKFEKNSENENDKILKFLKIIKK